jgi:hypothetical protein
MAAILQDAKYARRAKVVARAKVAVMGPLAFLSVPKE